MRPTLRDADRGGGAACVIVVEGDYSLQGSHDPSKVSGSFSGTPSSNLAFTKAAMCSRHQSRAAHSLSLYLGVEDGVPYLLDGVFKRAEQSEEFVVLVGQQVQLLG